MGWHRLDDPVAWGMPEDYNDLTDEGQKLARVWRIQYRPTPRDDVLSWNFFRSFYLNWEGSFFYDHWVEPAPGHFEWVWAAHQFPRLLMTAHRGSAKSTIMSKELPLRDLVSLPNSENFIILSSDAHIQRHTDKLMMEISGNKRIIDDFGVLRPKRTEGVWNHHYLRLNNYAAMVMGTVNSLNLRGLRPRTAITLDDVERDPKAGTNIELMIADTDKFFFQVVLPMARKHCKVRLCGTPNNKQTLIWRLQNDGDDRIDDSVRFHNVQYWFFNKDGSVFWPGEYPTEKDVEIRRKELGPDVWAMEMLGEASAGEHALLHVDPVKNEYTLEDPGSFDIQNPLDCQSIMKWVDSRPGQDGPLLVPRQEIASKVFRHMHRVITVDYAPTIKKTSDMSVVQVFGIDGLNQVFSLDLWGGRVRQDELITRIWSMARKWRVRVVGVEAVALQTEFYGRVAQFRDLFATGGWMPQPVPIRYEHGMSKPERISAIRWRFTEGAIKFPAWRRSENDYRMLYDQIAGFNPDPLRNSTGLGHDDHIDTAAMVQELIGGRRGATIGREPSIGVVESIRRGVKEIIPGVPIGTMVPLNQLPMDAVDLLMQRHVEKADERVVWESSGL